MNISEIKFTYLSVGDLCAKILESRGANTREGLLELLDNKDIEVDNIIISITKIVMKYNFLPIMESVVNFSGNNNPTLINTILGDTQELISNKGFCYTSQNETVGIPPKSFLRTSHSDNQVLHATLSVGFSGETKDSEPKKAIFWKSLYYNKDFFPISEDD
jgi:hypothetical protein